MDLLTCLSAWNNCTPNKLWKWNMPLERKLAVSFLTYYVNYQWTSSPTWHFTSFIFTANYFVQTFDTKAWTCTWWGNQKTTFSNDFFFVVFKKLVSIAIYRSTHKEYVAWHQMHWCLKILINVTQLACLKDHWLTTQNKIGVLH